MFRRSRRRGVGEEDRQHDLMLGRGCVYSCDQVEHGITTPTSRSSTRATSARHGRSIGCGNAWGSARRSGARWEVADSTKSSSSVSSFSLVANCCLTPTSDLPLVSFPILLLSSGGLLLVEGAFELDRRDVAERRVTTAAVVEERRDTQTTFACSHLCSQALRSDWTRTDVQRQKHLVGAVLWTLMDTRIPVRVPWQICARLIPNAAPARGTPVRRKTRRRRP